MFEDPLRQVLIKYTGGSVSLGGSAPTGTPSFNTDAFVRDLDLAQKRNSSRFWAIVGILVLGFLVVMGFAFANPAAVKSQWLLGGTGIYTGGLGAMLLQLSRSWWRTDTLITVAKYAQPDTLDLIIRTLLQNEAGKPKAARRKRPAETR
jgi:hypothetical protein